MYIAYNPKTLAQMVISQRKQLKLSQTDVGELVGLKQKTISAFENRPENTKLETLYRILSAVNLYILTQDRSKPLSSKKTWKEEW